MVESEGGNSGDEETAGRVALEAANMEGRLPIGSKASCGPSGESGSPRQRATVKLPARSPLFRAAQLANIMDEASRNSAGSGVT